MKNSALFLLFVLISAFYGPQLVAQKLESSEGKFSVGFPCKYEESMSEGDTHTTYKFTCKKDGQTFFVGFTVHETEISGHKEMAEVSVDSFSETISGEILTKTDWKAGKNTGLKTTMIINSNNTMVDYWAILIGQIQYQVVVLAPKEEYKEKAARKFLKSFKFKK